MRFMQTKVAVPGALIHPSDVKLKCYRSACSNFVGVPCNEPINHTVTAFSDVIYFLQGRENQYGVSSNGLQQL